MQIYSYKWGKMIIRHCVLLSLAEISIRRRIIILTRSYQMQRKRSTKTGIFAGQSQNSWPVNAKKRGGGGGFGTLYWYVPERHKWEIE